ncbi:MAG: SDR family oxidoreductase [Thermoplasmata archaeon]
MLMSRVALVTGASRGTGRACAIRLAKDGFDVIINYLKNEDMAKETLAHVLRAGRKGLVVSADVSMRSDVRSMFETAGREIGLPLVLVNNAGIYPRQLFDEIDDQDWKKVLRTNLDSVYHCCKLAIPRMKEEGWGRIVNISSMLGFKGSTQGAHYGASKAAIIGLTKSLALEVARYGILVNAVAPGAIDTDILAGYNEEQKAKKFGGIPAGRIGMPEDVAAAVSFLCSEDANYIVGETIHVNGGYLIV